MPTEDIFKSGLAEIGDVMIDTSLPGDLRMDQYLERVQNPYCFLCEGTPVQIAFVNGEKKLSEALVDYFRTLK